MKMENNPDIVAVEEKEEKKVGKDALLVAGAIILGSVIVASALFFLSSKVAVAPTKEADKVVVPAAAAVPPGAKVTVTMDQIKALFNDKNLAFGDKNSQVLFVEFSDPSCPYCHAAAGKNASLNKQMGPQFTLISDGGTYLAPVPEMKKLVDTGKAGFVWMYANGHGNGEMGTKALYCAKEKGKFWEAHDLIMSEAGYNLINTDIKNDKTKSGALANFLKSAVNAVDMKTCLDSGKYDNRLTDDMNVARQFGFSGTPDFFVNTDNFVGAISFKDIQPIVEKYLK